MQTNVFIALPSQILAKISIDKSRYRKILSISICIGIYLWERHFQKITDKKALDNAYAGASEMGSFMFSQTMKHVRDFQPNPDRPIAGIKTSKYLFCK